MGNDLQKRFDLDSYVGIAPGSIATTTKTGNFIDLGNAHDIAFLLVIGAVTAAVSASLLQGTTAGTTGGSTKAVSGASTTIGTSDANSVKILEVEASEIDVANGYNSIALKLVAAGAGAAIGASVVRKTRYKP